MCIAAGCGNPNLRVDSTLPHGAPSAAPDQATVVFMRTGRFGSRSINIVEAGSHTVFAQLGSQQWTVVQFQPGPVDWYLSLGNIGTFDPIWARYVPYDHMEGVLQAGRVYYVFVAPMSETCRGCGTFEVMRPGHEQWDARAEHMREHDRIDVNTSRATAYSRDDIEELTESHDKSRRRFNAMGPQERAMRIFLATDGIGVTSTQTSGGSTTTAPAAAPRPPAAPQTPTSCGPDASCGSGLLCHQSLCISACNPQCAANEVCADGGVCVSACNPPCPSGQVCSAQQECLVQ